MKPITKIPINIWDDFYSDNHVPTGEIQQTFAYVEDANISKETKKICLEILYNYIKNYFPSRVEVSLIFNEKRDRWQINFVHITHALLDDLMADLKQVSFDFDSIPFKIYSES